ncbi:AIDA repeat-containing protein [Escherichia coli]
MLENAGSLTVVTGSRAVDTIINIPTAKMFMERCWHCTQ